MTPSRGYYSVVQYCPDPGRFEAANIGVLLFCPERKFLQARTSVDNRRIRKFFGSTGHDWKRINAIKKSLVRRVLVEEENIRTLEDLQTFIATRANQIQITPPKPTKVFDPHEDLERLFHRIIDGRSARERSPSLREILSEKFSQPDVRDKIVRDVKVTIPLLHTEVHFPFGFQNGRFNVIDDVQFKSEHQDALFKTACKYAVEGKSIYETPDPRHGEQQLVVVGRFRPQDETSPGFVAQIFDQYKVKLFPEDRVSSLIDEIRRTGKDIASNSS